MNNSYDVAIIGCGTAGIFAGYELIARHPELKICVLDQGGDIYPQTAARSSPARSRECIHCRDLRHDVRLRRRGRVFRRQVSISRLQFGGWLTDFMDADDGHGAYKLRRYRQRETRRDRQRPSPPNTARGESARARRRSTTICTCFRQRCKHLGTENNLRDPAEHVRGSVQG